MKSLLLHRHFLLVAALFVVTACSGGGGTGPTIDPPTSARLLVSATTNVLDPSTERWPSVAAAAIDGARIDGYYKLTTPADTPFAFDLVTWRPGSSGTALIGVRHLRAGGGLPSGEASWIEAGVQLQGQGLFRGHNWLTANGDGFARLTVSGRITADQLFAVAAENGQVTLVAIAIGPESAIRRPEGGVVQLPVGATRQTIYSSAAWNFGMPAIAVSGDRTSIVCYEGDQFRANDPLRRYELRMQHAAATGTVTGGGTREWSNDTGYWRDHEAFALYNVLGVVRSEAEGVRVRLSFDRGATFAQDALVASGGAGGGSSRLVQAAIAADYSLAIGAWQVAANGIDQQFVLVEGRPVSFDGFGSPTAFAFDLPQVVFTAPADSSPLTTGIAWSAGNDLVVGYGVSWLARLPQWSSTTQFRCATRLAGGPLLDTVVDEESRLFGNDPSVAVTGQGASLRIFYVYESAAGVVLATSDDGGVTFALGDPLGHPGDSTPQVLVREIGGQTRVDVLYLAQREPGLELHRAHCADWPAAPFTDSALTRASTEVVTYTAPFPWGGWFPYGLRTKQVNWFGFDAVLDGDTIVVVYDEMTIENAYVSLGAMAGAFGSASTTSIPAGGFSAPPPLAPGLTQPMRPPQASDAHQLVMLRLP